MIMRSDHAIRKSLHLRLKFQVINTNFDKKRFTGDFMSLEQKNLPKMSFIVWILYFDQGSIYIYKGWGCIQESSLKIKT